MTITRTAAGITYKCDVAKSARCEETLETGESDWTAAFTFARTKGWGAAPLTGGTGWIHYCGRCPRP